MERQGNESIYAVGNVGALKNYYYYYYSIYLFVFIDKKLTIFYRINQLRKGLVEVSEHF